MNARRFALACVVSFAMMAAAVALAHAGTYTASSTTNPDGTVTVQWSYGENPSYPSGRPDWVGYDVLRATFGTCGTFERINDTIFPRVIGENQSYTFTDTPPASNAGYAYNVIPVDANRQPLALLFPDCDLCSGRAYATTPLHSVPATQGTLQDIGWTLLVQPCASGCWPGCYVAGAMLQSLRAYADGSTIVRLYGDMACEGFEGCALNVTQYELVTCDAVPTARTSWGRLKAIYR